VGVRFVKFLVLWSFQAAIRVGLPEVAKMISDLQDYAKELEGQKKLECYYHVVGRHGGAWIFDVKSNEELEILLAKMPVYNFAKYEVYPLSEMKAP
jgi:muconolactone delta-isomerase